MLYIRERSHRQVQSLSLSPKGITQMMIQTLLKITCRECPLAIQKVGEGYYCPFDQDYVLGSDLATPSCPTGFEE